MIGAWGAWNKPWQFSDGADPTITTGSTLYNSPTLGYSTISSFNSIGWKSSAFFTPAGNTFIENELTLGRINLGIIPAGSYFNNQYYQLANHSSPDRPYLAIDYTPPSGPPSCATLSSPANGSSNATAPVSWSAVGGATGYDVYFGTSITPPLVSTNQAGTSYTPSGCLLPGTTYYWRVVPKNDDGDATGCPTWSFTTDSKLLVYQTDWEDANEGYFGTSGASVDGWYTNSTATNGYGETNTWTLSTGTLGINGKSAGVSALNNFAYAGNPFQYYQDIGTIHRWIYRPMDLTGLRDVEVSFNWRCGGEAGYDYGEVATSINGGSNWLTDNQGGLNNDGEYSGSANTVQAESIVLPASRNNESNFVLAFKWNNDDSYSLDPSFVVDDIFVKACPYEGIISSTATAPGVFEWNPTGSTETTLTINGSHSCAQYEWEQSTDGGTNWVAAVGGSGAATVSYTTPNNISVSTWYRCRVYYGTGCPGAYQDEPFKIGPPVVLACQEVDNPTIALGTPANGLNHHLDLTWDAVTGATEYDVEVSTTGIFTGTPTATVATNSYDFDAGDSPNVQYYFQVRASDGTSDCAWTDFGSLYTAADNPALPTVNNATGATLDVTLVNETPVNNPAITTYSIKENNSGLFVQANGSLGAIEVFQTKAAWGTVTVAGLSSNTEYCFLATAQNGDGDTRGGGAGATLLTSEPFNTAGSLITGASNTAAFWSPATCTTGGLSWNATNGCTAGAVGFSGNWNNYFGCFLRTPTVDATGTNEVELTFDVSHSYSAAHPNDRMRIYFYADGGYTNNAISSLKINGVDALASFGVNGQGISYDQLRNCSSVKVRFDISAVTDKSNILFYLEPSSGYHNSHVFSTWIDNVSFAEAAPTACATTTACTPGTWTGITSTDWSNSGNWSCGVLPTPTSDVTIPTAPSGSYFPTIDVASVTVNDLTVEANATLTIPGSRSFTTTGAVTNNGTVTVNDGGNFIQTTGSTHTGSGTFVVQRQGNGSGGFNAWSTPVVNGNLPGSNGHSYNSLLGTNSGDDDNNPNPDPGWVPHSGAMTTGVGYFSVNGNAATFTGTANNGNYAPSVTTSGQPLNSLIAPSFFNLIGNPYPSSLDADQFIADNSSVIDGALYFWSDENAGTAAFSTDDYATYSTGGAVVPLTAGGGGVVPVGSIPSCQGFFVNATNNGNINFNNAQRGGSNGQFFRMATPDAQRIWLSINNDNLELFNQTLVAFDEFATDQKDWGVDAYKFRGNPAISIGAQQDNETYVIATYAPIPQNGKVIPLMTYVETAATYTFVADSMEGFENHNVFLEDLSNGQLYPLTQGSSYSFAMTSADEYNRFQLWFSPKVITGVAENESLFRIYTSENNMVVVETNSAQLQSGTIEITDMAGRAILSRPITLSNGVGRVKISEFANGVYAVIFVGAEGQTKATQKVVLGR